jgi:hypothetical protein
MNEREREERDLRNALDSLSAEEEEWERIDRQDYDGKQRLEIAACEWNPRIELDRAINLSLGKRPKNGRTAQTE